MRRRTPRTERRGEAGTASLETLLCLPFIFLIFALVLNVGYGWVARLRADAAVRYAGTSYVHRLSDGLEHAAAERATVEDLRHSYYPEGEAFSLSIDSQDTDLEGEVHAHGGRLPSGSLLESLRLLGRKLSGRHQIYLTVPRRVPTRTLLPDTPVQVAFALDGNTWTYAEVPIGFKALTDAGRNSSVPIRIVSWAAKGVFWLLGMEA